MDYEDKAHISSRALKRVFPGAMSFDSIYDLEKWMTNLQGAVTSLTLTTATS